MQHEYSITDGRDNTKYPLDPARPWRVIGKADVPEIGRGDNMMAMPIHGGPNDWAILFAKQEARDERYKLESAAFEESLCVAGIAILVGLAMAACVVYFRRFDALTSKGGA